MFVLKSADGLFEVAYHDLSAHHGDPEFSDHGINEMFLFSDLLLFGGVAFEMMAGIWPTAEAVRNDPVVAGNMNASLKVVFSRTLTASAGSNTRLEQDTLEDEVRRQRAVREGNHPAGQRHHRAAARTEQADR
jgi:hypothetical protein